MTTNLLFNPTFQDFRPIPSPTPGAGILAAGWSYGYDRNKRRPEGRQGSVPPNDDWEGAQQFFSTAAQMDVWVYQRVHVGKESIGKVFVFGARCALKSVNVGSGIGEYYAAVGIDRRGEEDPARKTAQWLTPQHQFLVPKWTNLEVRAPIESEWVTVYVQAANKYPVDGSLFIKSAYGYIVEPSTQPEPEPEPGEPGDIDLAPVLAELAKLKTQIDGLVETLAKPWSIQK